MTSDRRWGLMRQVLAGPELIREPGALQRFLESVRDAPFLAVDTESTGLDPYQDRLLLIQIGTAERQGLIDAQAFGRAALAAILATDQLLVMHHAKFDLKMLAMLGGADIDLSVAPVMDTMVAEQLLRNGRRQAVAAQGFGLQALAERYAGMGLDKSVREGFIAASGADALGEVELRYAQRDVEATWKVFAAQLPLLAADGLIKVASIEGAACWGFAEMERAGMPIDVAAWRGLIAEAERDRTAARKTLDQHFAPAVSFDLFGQSTINYDSEQEVLEALAKLGVKVASTRREALLSSGHPAAVALVEYKEHQKIVSTYGESFLAHVHPRTGRLHSSFKALGAITGRAASSEPNLQNIPAGSKFRACFRAPSGRRLITADYSAAELRILAEVSNDPVFVRTFLDGGDLHSIVAARIFGKPVSKTENPELRSRAKAINFGLAYGMGSGGLAQQIGSTVEEAEGLLERYFRAFPAIRGYLEESAHHALRRGYAETLAGRRFWFQDLTAQGADEGSRLRVAKNMPIQGSNADMTKLAMARIARSLAERRLNAHLVNMVHDEIVVEASEVDAEATRQVVVNEMISAGQELVRRVPVEVEAHVSEAWTK